MPSEHLFVAAAGEKVLHAARSIAQIAACVRTGTELVPVQAHLTSVVMTFPIGHAWSLLTDIPFCIHILVFKIVVLLHCM